MDETGRFETNGKPDKGCFLLLSALVLLWSGVLIAGYALWWC